MKILVVGANGFIGQSITAKLIQDGQDVICAVRDVDSTKRKFPGLHVIHCDFNTDTTPEQWLPKLQNVDVVINVAGLLTSVGKNKIQNVHVNGPKALFDACVLAKVKRVIHISALGIAEEETTDYALTKKAADHYLASLKGIDWLILQPSLIYASGSYGGTSLFRALASLPYIIPLIGDGSQQFQPIHMDDLTDALLACIKKKEKIFKTLKVTGPDVVTMKEILIHFRGWLGLSPAKLVKIPLLFIKIGAMLGDLLGVGPLNSTSYKMMLQPNVASNEELVAFTGVIPRGFEQGLATEPLTVQSLWHGRLFFLKPLLKIALGLFWISSGAITAFIAPDLGLKTLLSLGISEQLAHILLYGSCFADIILGVLLLTMQSISFICALQILLIVTYTVFLSMLSPTLWLEPLGPLTKNIPMILLTLVLLGIEKDK
jgi:uncharacterized protein YbjT (DUF2867 family)